MRRSRSLYGLLALIPLLGACDQGERRSPARPERVMVHDTVASRSFSRFVDSRARALEAALIQAGFQPDSSKHFDFIKSVRPVYKENIGRGYAPARLGFDGVIRIEGDSKPRSVVLTFVQTDSGTWCLLMNKGYADLHVLSHPEELTGGLPPEFHTAVKRTFPDAVDDDPETVSPCDN